MQGRLYIHDKKEGRLSMQGRLYIHDTGPSDYIIS